MCFIFTFCHGLLSPYKFLCCFTFSLIVHSFHFLVQAFLSFYSSVNSFFSFPLPVLYQVTSHGTLLSPLSFPQYYLRIFIVFFLYIFDSRILVSVAYIFLIAQSLFSFRVPVIHHFTSHGITIAFPLSFPLYYFGVSVPYFIVTCCFQFSPHPFLSPNLWLLIPSWTL